MAYSINDIEVKVGQTWVRRDGSTDTIEEVQERSDDDPHPIIGSDEIYTSNGRVFSDLRRNGHDLIALVPVPTIPTANDIQHGGTHYRTKTIQPWDYVAANDLGFFEGNAIKYLSRWRDKGGVEDLRKARHYVDKLIEIEEGKS